MRPAPPFYATDHCRRMNEEIKDKNCVMCPRCQADVSCRHDNISACHCAGVSLSAGESLFIRHRFRGCLCQTCLQELKTEYHMMNQSLPPAENKLRNLLPLLFFLCTVFGSSQTYHPPAGQAGTNAIYMDSSVFVNWATGCQVTRGYQDISDPSLGLASVGDQSMATGKAQSNGVISLGDGGWAVCTFEYEIRNGAGYDFAVFENGFDDTFLELAFVEVSSDGQHFFRFPAHSETDTSTQTGSFGATDARKINNLAGKYRGGYGTPFDLQELAGTEGLDIDRITHVKIVDVVGSMNPAYATRDAQGNKVNDPWPTAFPSGGFDLDAIGVIHQNAITGLSELTHSRAVKVYPNPVQAGGEVYVTTGPEDVFVEVWDSYGRLVYEEQSPVIRTAGWEKGVYLLRLRSAGQVTTSRLILM